MGRALTGFHPMRIQLSRRRGWRLPEGALSVARPGGYGNPYRVGVHGTAAECIAKMRADLLAELAAGGHRLRKLHGRSLACWCRLCPAHEHGKPLGVDCPDCAPCHADMLLMLANPPHPQERPHDYD